MQRAKEGCGEWLGEWWANGGSKSFSKISAELLFESTNNVTSLPANNFALAITFLMENPFAINDIRAARSFDNGVLLEGECWTYQVDTVRYPLWTGLRKRVGQRDCQRTDTSQCLTTTEM